LKGVVKTFSFEHGTQRLQGTHTSLVEASRSLPAGAYTTLRTYRGRRVLRLAQHVARLNESLGSSARVPLLLADARAALRAALDETRYPESRLRLTCAPALLFVSVEPYAPLPAALYAAGVLCATLRLQRENPHAKDTRFIATAASARDALPRGFHEGLLVADDGAILEGLSSNFFAIAGGVLRTEEERALLGVTRSLVLELAHGVLPVSTRAVTRKELPSAGEAFLTSVSRGILPIVGIDDHTIADGRPGPTTRELMRRFAELEAREAEEV
jgi:branched-chain amino acid aminotransferase